MTSLPSFEQTPKMVSWAQVEAFEDLDQRVSAVTVLFGSVVGVNDGTVEWCPDDTPPTEQERLAWLWLIQPSNYEHLNALAGSSLRDLMDCYHRDEMADWWSRIANPDASH